MLFAAGFGRRMGALTKDRPKPLLQVAGQSLLNHALNQTRGFSFKNRVVNVHYLAEQIIAHLAIDAGLKVSNEKGKILETGGGLRAALSLLGMGPVLTLNTDAIWQGGSPVGQLLAAWDPNQMDALLLLGEMGRVVGHKGLSDFGLDAEGRIKREKSKTGFLYLGAQIVKTDTLHHIAEQCFSLNLIWDEVIRNGRGFGLVYDGNWCGVGCPENIVLAEALIKSDNV
jgi:MurNAc alpha-1-phosphate uridylyltransferase